MGEFTPQTTIDCILWDSQSMDISQLHEKHGIKKVTIRAILYRNKLKPIKPNPQRYLISKEKLEEIFKDGWISTEELCKRCGKSYPTVMKSLKAYGIVKKRKPSVRRNLRSSRIFKILGYLMANPEMNHAEIARQFLCTRELVGQIEASARQEGIIK